MRRGAFQTARSCHSPQPPSLPRRWTCANSPTSVTEPLRPAEIAQTPAGAGRRRGDGARGGAGVATIMAPMPGKVVRVLVAPGAAVEADQGIVVVEAMKMQNELKAPRAGRVISVAAKEGATVAAGETLATIAGAEG